MEHQKRAALQREVLDDQEHHRLLEQQDNSLAAIKTLLQLDKRRLAEGRALTV